MAYLQSNRSVELPGLKLVPEPVKPYLKITLYPPYGEPEEYYDCTVLSGLMPELEFKGSRKGRSSFLCRESHITSTTLPYKIEALTDVVN